MAMLYSNFLKFKQAYQILLDEGIEPTVSTISGHLPKTFKQSDIEEGFKKMALNKERETIKEQVTVEKMLAAFKYMHAKGLYQSVPNVRQEMGIPEGFSNEFHRCLLQIKVEYPEFVVPRNSSRIRKLISTTYWEMVAAETPITITTVNNELVLKGHTLHRAAISKYLIEIRGKNKSQGKKITFTQAMMLEAIKDMESQGIKPTATKIREKMGGGTYYLIRDYLNEYVDSKTTSNPSK